MEENNAPIEQGVLPEKDQNDKNDSEMIKEASLEENNIPVDKGDIPETNRATESNTEMNMKTLLEEEGLALDFPQAGEIRTGVIASIGLGQFLG